MPRRRKTDHPTHRKLRVERLEDRAMLAGELELVRDMNSTPLSSAPSYVTAVGGIVYFAANDGISGSELWRSDGTHAGTVRVKDIVRGSASSTPTDLTDVAGTLFFIAYDGVSNRSLWKSDGTDAGTVRVKDVSQWNNGSQPGRLTNVAGTLYFAANDAGGRELWKSDGTESGTVRVKDIASGVVAGSFPLSSDPRHLTNVGGKLFFSANDGVSGVELWTSDGTESGTVRVKDIRPGLYTTHPTPRSSFLDSFTDVSGTLYFTANDGVTGSELWRSDGTESGTVRVKDVNPGSSDSNLRQLLNVGGTLYFAANHGGAGYELWKSDGTEGGTVQVTDAFAVSRMHLSDLVNAGGVLYFITLDGARRNAIWRSDGTAEGTERVTSSSWAFASSLTTASGTLYFTANDGLSGYELWKSDGTEAGTTLVKDVRPRTLDASPSYLTNVGGALYFTANDAVSGAELWKSDGTRAGTAIVKDILPGANGPPPSNLTNVNGTLYFTANDGLSGVELWKSDGTAAGTIRVKDIYAGARGSYPRNLTKVQGLLYFSANDDVSGRELWKSDGTEIGTVRVKDVAPGFSYFYPRDLAEVGGTLFFVASDYQSGGELWKSDGTEIGTVRVKDINVGVGGSSPAYLTNVNGALFFSADDGPRGRELWKSDGTEAGTVLVKNIRSFPYSAARSDPQSLTNLAGTLYFTAIELYVSPGSQTVWRSDGTESGTVRVKNTGSTGLDSRHLTGVGGHLYFTANRSQSSSSDLWRSDGTDVGTVPIKEFRSGNYSTSFVALRILTNVGGTLYFADTSRTGDSELWKSDGTDATTIPVRFRDGTQVQNPRSIVPAGDRVFVVGSRHDAGEELFSQVLIDPPAVAGDFDRNGLIDQLDYAVWVADYGSGTRLRADGNADGVVNAADYTVWRDNFVDDDHADTATGATPIALGSTTTGRIGSPSDSDWFSFAVVAGTKLRIQTLPGGTLADTSLTLVGTDGVTQLAFNDNAGALNRLSQVAWTAPASGTYFVAVRGVGGNTGTYTLLLSDDHANSSVGATSVVVSSTNGGLIGPGGDSDWFSFAAVAGTIYRLHTLPGGTLADTTLTLVGADGVTQVAFNDDWPGRLSLLIWTAPTSGTYFLTVLGAGANTGTYSLAVVRLASRSATSNGEDAPSEADPQWIAPLDEAFAALAPAKNARTRFTPAVRGRL
ncbi:MAG: ELWxxDGT repeat protein [Lacipirellulaceae bacterium]